MVLLRKGEAESVMKTFAEGFNMNVIKVDAEERFMNKLKGVADPEKKRKIIGNEFIYVFDDEAAKLKGMDFLLKVLFTQILLKVVQQLHKRSNLTIMLVDFLKICSLN